MINSAINGISILGNGSDYRQFWASCAVKVDALVGRLHICDRKLVTTIAKFAIGCPMVECVVQVFSWVEIETNLAFTGRTDSYWWCFHMILSMIRANP